MYLCVLRCTCVPQDVCTSIQTAVPRPPQAGSEIQSYLGHASTGCVFSDAADDEKTAHLFWRLES